VPKIAKITRNIPDKIIKKSTKEAKFPLGMLINFTSEATTKISAILSIIRTEKIIGSQVEFELEK
jgi:hypothetical protein